MTREQITNSILPLLERYGVRRASLFGSVVRGDDTPASDIDILVELPDSASLLELAALKVDLEEALSREVDILTYDSLHPLLRDRILREQERIL
jgi:predicted nucleotidyltransferase